MNILGISAFYHDSAATLVTDGRILCAAQEERFTRIKFDASFPMYSIKFCLGYAGLKVSDLDFVVFYDKPWLKFERLLETYLHYAPKGLSSFLAAMPVWLKDKIFLKNIIVKELKKAGEYDSHKTKLLFSEHHLSHAASAFYPSPFKEAVIVTLDGVGEWATASINIGRGSKITVLKELYFPNSLGLLYSSFTYYLGFTVNSGEYKMMGLAPYGIKGSAEVEKMKEIIRTRLIDIKEDGSLLLHQKMFRYSTGLRMVNDKQWRTLFGFPKREPESAIDQHHANLALAIQEVTEEIVTRIVKHAKSLVPNGMSPDNLCLAGGVALNCVANGKIIRENIFKNIYIQPAAGDAGGSIGAALAAWYLYANNERNSENNQEGMAGSLLGPEYQAAEIVGMARRFKAPFSLFDFFNDIASQTAQFLSDGKVVGWFQGKMEFGPRALGNRSILGDSRNPEMQKKLNLKIKFREGFRPFAPAVLEESADEYFDIPVQSPYMLLVANVKKSRQIPLPDGYNDLTLMEKLYTLRSDIPAVTHLDYSARLQTVSLNVNSRFHTLLEQFKLLTGCSVLINTSFNVRGEPIVCTPEDAYLCFMRTDMDYLVIGNYLFDKNEQPAWNDKDWDKNLLKD